MTKIRMRNGRVLRQSCVALGLMASVTLAATPLDSPTSLSLRSNNLASMTTGGGFVQPSGGGGGGGVGMTLDGPYFLRSADTLPAGEMELKFFYGFAKTDGGDSHELEFVLEWGLMDGLEFIMEIPITLGEGRVEGNGDIKEFGFHIRHWDEDGYMPAFATRHLVRIPTGYHSDGVDYLARGLMTWTMNDTVRLHFNPFWESINGNRDTGGNGFSRLGAIFGFGRNRHHDDPWSRWGAAIGFDCKPRDNLRYIIDYKIQGSDGNGGDNQHTIEIGGDWEFAPGETFAWGTEFDIDSDDGDDFTIRFGYIIEIDPPNWGG